MTVSETDNVARTGTPEPRCQQTELSGGAEDYPGSPKVAEQRYRAPGHPWRRKQ